MCAVVLGPPAHALRYYCIRLHGKRFLIHHQPSVLRRGTQQRGFFSSLINGFINPLSSALRTQQLCWQCVRRRRVQRVHVLVFVCAREGMAAAYQGGEQATGFLCACVRSDSILLLHLCVLPAALCSLPLLPTSHCPNHACTSVLPRFSIRRINEKKPLMDRPFLIGQLN